MVQKKVAFPGTIDGINSAISGHFGHTPAFIAIMYDDDIGDIQSVEIIENPPHQAGGGGCMTPVMLLKNNNVDSVVLRGIGYRPLMGFKQVGINTFLGVDGAIKDNFELFFQGKLELLHDSSCQH